MIQVAMMRRLSLLLLMTLSFAGASEGQSLRPAHGDLVIKNFRFTSGEILPSLKLHYRTFGKPQRDAKGIVRNAVLILHGTGGTGAQFETPTFAGQLFVPGGLLDANRYFLILPDSLGFGQSSKPSDGLRANFPRYGYIDIIDRAAQAAHRRSWRESSPSRHGDLHGRACTCGCGGSNIRSSWTR